MNSQNGYLGSGSDLFLLGVAVKLTFQNNVQIIKWQRVQLLHSSRLQTKLARKVGREWPVGEEAKRMLATPIQKDYTIYSQDLE